MNKQTIFTVRHNNTICNVSPTFFTQDKAGGVGLLQLHSVVSQLTNPGRLFTTQKSCD